MSSYVHPVNPDAAPEARALLQLLADISGEFILTGQHNLPGRINSSTLLANDLTGKMPAVFGQDFGFSGVGDKDSIHVRPANIVEAIRQYRAGAIVTYTWHAVRPTHDEPVGFEDNIKGALTDSEWEELVTPDTNLNARWAAQVDEVARHLRVLQKARVPVLWRPYHEVNGDWFWWGGREGANGSAALFRLMFERFTHLHRLNNLVWVWNVNAPRPDGSLQYPGYFPGLDVMDVLSADIYGGDYRSSHYDGLIALAGGKPLALGEVGAVPSPDVLAAQPLWTWFMAWDTLVQKHNTAEELTATYESPRALSLGDPRLAERVATAHAASAAPY